MLEPIEKQIRLADPVATTGDRVYVICSQNGLFPDPLTHSHVPHEGWGVWNHPIKLLDGLWFGLRWKTSGLVRWLIEADVCRVGLGYTEFEYRLDDLRVTRRDCVPDGVEGLIMTITLPAPEAQAADIALLVLVRSDLRPAWLGEAVGLHDGLDSARVETDHAYVTFQDANNPWFAVVGSDRAAAQITVGDALSALQPTIGQGASACLTYPLALQPAETTAFTLLVAGSAQGKAAALATFAQLQSEHSLLHERKQQQMQQIAQTSKLRSPDPLLDQAFLWAKVNCQMLARATPEHGLGAGAGLPGYPWWFGIDSEYAVLPMLQAGLFDLVKATLRLLKQVSENENQDEYGRVIHELTTTGVVHNAGNLVETPLFTRAVHQCWQWTGDRAFLAEMYDFCKAGVLTYILGQCDEDSDLCPSGRSIIETLEMHAGFECLDPATYTWEALNRLIDMAGAMGEPAIIPTLQAKAEQLARCLREEWWLAEEGLFADVRSPVAEVRTALHTIDNAAANNPHNRDFQQQTAQAHRLFDPLLAARSDLAADIDLPWLLRHWVVMCPVEVGLATTEQAQRTLARLMSAEFSNEWGMYLHPDRHDVMSINTGLLALAHARYGQIDQALDLTMRLAKTLPLHMPGAISEAMPDQWCFLQLWSALGIVSPIVECVLGVAPQAGERKLRVMPKLPGGWNHANLHRLRVGDDYFDIQTTRSAQHYTISVTSDASDYDLELGVYLLEDDNVYTVTLDGQPVEWHWEATNAGRCLVCKANRQATLVVTLS